MNILEEKSNLLSEQVAKSANNLEGKFGVAKRTCSVIKQVRVLYVNSYACIMHTGIALSRFVNAWANFLLGSHD